MDECQGQLKTVKDQLMTVTEEAERLKPMLKERREVLNAAKQALRTAQVGRSLRSSRRVMLLVVGVDAEGVVLL